MMACKFCGEPAKATVSSTGIVTYTLNLNIWGAATHAAESATRSVLRAGRPRALHLQRPLPHRLQREHADVPLLRSARGRCASQAPRSVVHASWSV